MKYLRKLFLLSILFLLSSLTSITVFAAGDDTKTEGDPVSFASAIGNMYKAAASGSRGVELNPFAGIILNLSSFNMRTSYDYLIDDNGDGITIAEELFHKRYWQDGSELNNMPIKNTSILIVPDTNSGKSIASSTVQGNFEKDIESSGLKIFGISELSSICGLSDKAISIIKTWLYGSSEGTWDIQDIDSYVEICNFVLKYNGYPNDDWMSRWVLNTVAGIESMSTTGTIPDTWKTSMGYSAANGCWLNWRSTACIHDKSSTVDNNYVFTLTECFGPIGPYSSPEEAVLSIISNKTYGVNGSNEAYAGITSEVFLWLCGKSDVDSMIFDKRIKSTGELRTDVGGRFSGKLPFILATNYCYINSAVDSEAWAITQPPIKKSGNYYGAGFWVPFLYVPKVPDSINIDYYIEANPKDEVTVLNDSKSETGTYKLHLHSDGIGIFGLDGSRGENNYIVTIDIIENLTNMFGLEDNGYVRMSNSISSWKDTVKDAQGNTVSIGDWSEVGQPHHGVTHTIFGTRPYRRYQVTLTRDELLRFINGELYFNFNSVTWDTGTGNDKIYSLGVFYVDIDAIDTGEGKLQLEATNPMAPAGMTIEGFSAYASGACGMNYVSYIAKEPDKDVMWELHSEGAGTANISA